MKNIQFKSATNQKGFVLPVGMILLGVMTVLGIGAMRDSAMQERMSQNYIDREVSFQAAESALRIAEIKTLRNSYETISASNNFVNTSESPQLAHDYSNLAFEDDQSFGTPLTTVSTASASVPRVIIEELQDRSSLKKGKDEGNPDAAARFFRVTAYAEGQTDSARTTLQAVFFQE